MTAVGSVSGAVRYSGSVTFTTKTLCQHFRDQDTLTIHLLPDKPFHEGAAELVIAGLDPEEARWAANFKPKDNEEYNKGVAEQVHRIKWILNQILLPLGKKVEKIQPYWSAKPVERGPLLGLLASSISNVEIVAGRAFEKNVIGALTLKSEQMV